MTADEPPELTVSTWSDMAKGCAFTLLMAASAFFGSMYVLIPLLPLAYLAPQTFRRIVDRLIGFWLIMPMGLVEYIFGLRIHVSGQVVERHRPALIIMNHRTRLDWLFFWGALYRMDPELLTTEKISLKAILKYVPGVGWAMATNGYMFLNRMFASDKQRIEKVVNYFANSGEKYQLLFFPEGTDKCPLATERSRRFAEKNQLVHYDYVLHPRTTGFVYLLQQMRLENYVDYVYDVTVAYGDRIVQSELDFAFFGLSPREIHYDVRKISVKELPEDPVELEKWLKRLWAEKEERLRRFYTGLKRNPGQRLGVVAGGHTDFDLRALSDRAAWIRLMVVTFWTAVTLTWVYFFFTYPYQGYYGGLTALFFFGTQYACGGIEMLLADQMRLSLADKRGGTLLGNGAEAVNGPRMDFKKDEDGDCGGGESMDPATNDLSKPSNVDGNGNYSHKQEENKEEAGGVMVITKIVASSLK